jgi:hypothetical protein
MKGAGLPLKQRNALLVLSGRGDARVFRRGAPDPRTLKALERRGLVRFRNGKPVLTRNGEGIAELLDDPLSSGGGTARSQPKRSGLDEYRRRLMQQRCDSRSLALWED